MDVPTIQSIMARTTGGERISGRLGGRVYRVIDGQGFVSAMPRVVDPRTPAQIAARERLERAVALWRELPLDAMGRWRLFAEAGAAFDVRTGRRRSVRGDLVFRGLAAKYMQIHGGMTAPTEPPASAFTGDGVAVTVSDSPSPDGSFGRGGRGERLPEPPPPHPTASYACSQGTSLSITNPMEEGVQTLQEEPLGEGAILFSASAPNSPGVLTELLTQRLAAAWRKPHPNEYRTRGFVAFESGATEAVLPCAPGAYACAIRFVRADSGQASPLLPLGTVVVP